MGEILLVIKLHCFGASLATKPLSRLIADLMVYTVSLFEH